MKKKSNNLEEMEFLTLEQRVLRSDLSEEDKIEIIKIIGRDRTTSWTTATPSYIYSTGPTCEPNTGTPCPLSATTYCSCCSQEA